MHYNIVQPIIVHANRDITATSDCIVYICVFVPLPPKTFRVGEVFHIIFGCVCL